ncbi:MAG: dipeptidyl aminopeptidase, partial [Terrimicrobiaceae bacterium]
NGTNDFAFPMDSWQKSYRLPQGMRTLALRVRMDHGHGGAGENPPEIHVQADALFRGGSPLAQITRCSLEGGTIRASFESLERITNAELNYTTDASAWVDRHWQTLPAELDAAGGMVSALLPAATTVCYLNLFDSHGRVVSSEHVVI